MGCSWKRCSSAQKRSARVQLRDALLAGPGIRSSKPLQATTSSRPACFIRSLPYLDLAELRHGESAFRMICCTTNIVRSSKLRPLRSGSGCCTFIFQFPCGWSKRVICRSLRNQNGWRLGNRPMSWARMVISRSFKCKTRRRSSFRWARIEWYVSQACMKISTNRD